MLVDLGGLPTQENRAILEHCDYYVFLKRPDKKELIQKWQELLDSLDIKPLAIFDSVWEGDPVHRKDYVYVFKGVLVRLDRGGVPDATVRVIEKFGEFLIEKFGGVGMEEKFSIKVREHPEWVLVDVTIGGNGLIAPDELEELIGVVTKTVNNKYFGKGVIISGRLPVWAHSALAHTFHGAKWVGHFDPRIGAVVTATHDTTKPIGTVIPHDKLSI